MVVPAGTAVVSVSCVPLARGGVFGDLAEPGSGQVGRRYSEQAGPVRQAELIRAPVPDSPGRESMPVRS